MGVGSLPGQYSGLFEQASQESFFLSLPWFRNFESTVLGPDEVVQVIGVETDDNPAVPVAALVLKVNRNVNGFTSPTRIESLANYYTSYFGPVLPLDHRQNEEAVRILANELCSQKHSWDTLNLRPLNLSLRPVERLHRALHDVGAVTQTYFCFGNWYLNVAGRSYAEYFRGLPSVVRKNVPYLRRRLGKIARVRIEILTKPEELDLGIQNYEAVYNASWRTAEAYPNFIRGLIRTAGDKGWLRLGLLYVDHKPAAAQVWIVHAGVASIYKIGYAEQFAKLSVGTVLTAELLERVIDVDKVAEVDYLSGDDAYKTNWMSERRERCGIMAFNPKSTWGQAGILRHVVGKQLKAKWQSVRRELIELCNQSR